jgi:hypothetical protein
MTWDGIPEHRNLHRGDQVPDLSPGASAARYLDAATARRAEQEAIRQRYLDDIAARRKAAADKAQARGDGASAQDYLRRLAEMRETRQPDAGGTMDGAMPPDPFSGTLPGAIAQAEMLHSLVEGGMTESQALYYLACLVQVGLAMRMGRFSGELPPWPPETTT